MHPAAAVFYPFLPLLPEAFPEGSPALPHNWSGHSHRLSHSFDSLRLHSACWFYFGPRQPKTLSAMPQFHGHCLPAPAARGSTRFSHFHTGSADSDTLSAKPWNFQCYFPLQKAFPLPKSSAAPHYNLQQLRPPSPAAKRYLQCAGLFPPAAWKFHCQWSERTSHKSKLHIADPAFGPHNLFPLPEQIDCILPELPHIRTGLGPQRFSEASSRPRYCLP